MVREFVDERCNVEGDAKVRVSDGTAVILCSVLC